MNLLVPLLVLWSGILLCAIVSGSFHCEVWGDHTDCSWIPRRNIFNGSNLVKDHGSIEIVRTNIVPFGPAQCSAFRNAMSVKLYRTDLKEVPAGCFDNFQHLGDLDLSNNAIEVIREGAFPNIIKLQHGKDSGQNSSIKSKISELDLENNKIHTIEDNALMAESLETLILRLNKMKDIYTKFKHLSGPIKVVCPNDVRKQDHCGNVFTNIDRKQNHCGTVVSSTQ